jgi:hypothetical protein
MSIICGIKFDVIGKKFFMKNGKKINEIIKKLRLAPFDGVVLISKSGGIKKHYALCAGYDEMREPVFVANTTKGISIISLNKAQEYLNEMNIIKVMRYKGNKELAQKRLMNLFKNRHKYSYNLLFNNCEHFFNYIWYGVPKSQQVENAAIGGMIGGALLAVTGKAPAPGAIIAGLSLLVFLNQKCR